MILAGDIGGTNTRLGFFELEGDRLKAAAMDVYPSREYESLDEIVVKFVAKHDQRAERACFGVAGPVISGRSRVSNLDWDVDADRLAQRLGLNTVTLSNDLEVNAYGIASLAPEDFVVLNEGEADASGNEALISAGTGLGEAGLRWEGRCHRPFPSEGGHVDFAPRDKTEADLLFFLMKEFPHVSYERVLSGPGLYNIYRFLLDTGREEEPKWLAEQIRESDPPVVVTRCALTGQSQLCAEALDLFVSIYGAEAGNLALKLMATGGVFIGGGIAPRIVEKLLEGTFMDAFVDKGRMTPVLERVPVRVIRNDRAALLGAARLASLGSEVC